VTAFYWLIKGLAWPIVRTYLRLRRCGEGRIPRKSSCIVVANHTSYLDAAVLGAACPRPLRFLISAEIYGMLRLTWFYYMMSTIPVRTDQSDMRAMRRALHALRVGDAIGIFPEGQRMADGQLGEGKLGVAFLAWRSGAPVIPTAIVGAHAAMPVGTTIPRPLPVQVRFGEALRFQETGGRPDKAELSRFADEVMQAISALGAPDSGKSSSEEVEAVEGGAR
jgi:1-acyl-sn-glycerol-3-phosphate acyltransferase